LRYSLRSAPLAEGHRNTSPCATASIARINSAVASACEMYPRTPCRSRRKTNRLSPAALNVMILLSEILLASWVRIAFVVRSCASTSKIRTSGCATTIRSSASPPNPLSPMHSSVGQSIRRARSPDLSNMKLLANQTRIFFEGSNFQPTIVDENKQPTNTKNVGRFLHLFSNSRNRVCQKFFQPTGDQRIRQCGGKCPQSPLICEAGYNVTETCQNWNTQLG